MIVQLSSRNVLVSFCIKNKLNLYLRSRHNIIGMPDHKGALNVENLLNYPNHLGSVCDIFKRFEKVRPNIEPPITIMFYKQDYYKSMFAYAANILHQFEIEII